MCLCLRAYIIFLWFFVCFSVLPRWQIKLNILLNSDHWHVNAYKVHHVYLGAFFYLGIEMLVQR